MAWIDTSYEVRMDQGLEGVFPDPERGVSARPLKLGPDEIVEAKVGEILNFDDYYFYEFSEGNGVFQVFVTYWKPGSINERYVTGHIPDSCWLSNGWRRLERVRDRELEFSGVRELTRWEYGLYTKNNTDLAVIFTHLADGAYSDYPVINDKPLDVWLPIALRKGFKAKPEQVFIRISWEDGKFDPEKSPFLGKLLRSIEGAFMMPGEPDPE